MAEILTISSAEVKIGEDDGKVVTVPIASLQFSNPQVGDRVNVFVMAMISLSAAPKPLLASAKMARARLINTFSFGLLLLCLARSVSTASYVVKPLLAF